jgi:hypothetical protein
MLSVAAKIAPCKSEWCFRALFGGPSEAVDYLFNAIMQLQPPKKQFSVTSLLLTLNFLKDPGTSELAFAARWRLDFRTCMKRIEFTLELIDSVLPEVISSTLSPFFPDSSECP